MRVQRFSAAEQFGVPIDDNRELYSVRGLLGLLGRYGVEGTDISDEVTEITPPYWTKNKFTYHLSQARPDGPAVVELRPVYEDAQTIEILAMTALGDVTVEVDFRRIEVPTDQAAFPLIGPSPRYAGKLCLHEAVINTEIMGDL